MLLSSSIEMPSSLYGYVSRKFEAIIVDKESMEQVMVVFAFLSKNDTSISEVHEYTMALPNLTILITKNGKCLYGIKSIQ